MNTPINQLNAGLLHTQARMAGQSLAEALDTARHADLHTDLNANPHRPTVLRLLKAMWLLADACAARNATNRAEAQSFDVAVAQAYPADWASACAKDGKARREAKRILRQRFRKYAQE